MDETNSRVASFQKALPGFGIAYSGRTDGIIDDAFTHAIHNLEELIQAKTGNPTVGKILSGGNLNMSAMEVYRNLFSDKPADKPIDKPIDTDPSPPKNENNGLKSNNVPQGSIPDAMISAFNELPVVKPIENIMTNMFKSNKPNDDIKSNMNDAFKNLLSSELPVVGKLYDGDLESAAKNLEVKIGKEIGKSITGTIWNDDKKTFNTTPDDIKNALSLIEKHRNIQPIKTTSSLDDRFLQMSKIFAENN